jgi:hypothetical protein
VYILHHLFRQQPTLEEKKPGKVITKGQRQAVSRLVAFTGTLAILTVLILPVVTAQAPARSDASFVIKTIDFSTHGAGEFQFDFYKRDGLVFTTAGSGIVALVQGDQAIGGPVEGIFRPAVFGIICNCSSRHSGDSGVHVDGLRCLPQCYRQQVCDCYPGYRRSRNTAVRILHD